ncbi:hypothetical protein ALI144C_37620 [Actinosynnema sp. ALI-1.44]|uniref:acyltransferase family protein n=1 Tax=Actinosynnema sp. ALI-1.44 TaxID=1933779 RepID=UPI00097BD18C|nr:acyltransferase [Actinosynnema sp. ALI-1.44]ONI76368.1 hypothetical protein ALI144C_37620 [Actinosynnema sp. ALI-1.44]
MVSSSDADLGRSGRTTGRSRLPTLTGMRFVAAGMVFFAHAFTEFPTSSGPVATALSTVWAPSAAIGVSFFFVLSGFVLAWSARPDDTARRFWRRRIFKIYPNHVVTFVITLGLMWLTGTLPTVWQFLSNLLLVHSWFPRYDLLDGINGVSWSLACEVFFYASFPLLIAGVRRIAPHRLWWWAAGVVVAIAIVPLVAGLLPGSALPYAPEVVTWQGWFVYFLPPVRALEFVLGMILAEIVRSGRWIPVGMGTATLLAVIGYVPATLVPSTFSLVAYLIVPIALIIGAGAVADVEGRFSPLRSRPLVWLGEISYALYLVHRLVLLYVLGALDLGQSLNDFESVVVVLALFVVSLLLSWLLYRAVEVPVLRRYGSSRRVGEVTPEPRRPSARKAGGRP